MARDKAKDDTFFNCSQQTEHDYVARLYDTEEKRQKVRELLAHACAAQSLHYSTHREVYALIEKRLGYPVPN